MLSNKRKNIWFLVVVFTSACGTHSPVAWAQMAKKPFTVADEMGLTLFDDPNGEPADIHFSPDGNYFAIWTERARLDLNVVEDSLRFYRSADVEHFVGHSTEPELPSPVWVVNRSETKGSVIHDWRWLADSSGVAFLERETRGNQRLVLADLRKKMVEPLTSASEEIDKFDVI